MSEAGIPFPSRGLSSQSRRDCVPYLLHRTHRRKTRSNSIKSHPISRRTKNPKREDPWRFCSGSAAGFRTAGILPSSWERGGSTHRLFVKSVGIWFGATTLPVVAEGAPRMYGHLRRIFCNHRIVVAPNIRVATDRGSVTASSRR
jgi:hypothetical protein